jgi:hypothetical protein
MQIQWTSTVQGPFDFGDYVRPTNPAVASIPNTLAEMQAALNPTFSTLGATLDGFTWTRTPAGWTPDMAFTDTPGDEFTLEITLTAAAAFTFPAGFGNIVLPVLHPNVTRVWDLNTFIVASPGTLGNTMVFAVMYRIGP